MHIAIDVGGVLIEKDGGTAEDTSFRVGAAAFVAGALDAVRALVDAGHTLSLLSYCGKRREVDTIDALAGAGLAAYIPRERWLFCRNRRLKALIMVERGMDVIVDDTWEVIDTVRHAGKRAVHFRGDGIDSAPDWPAVVRLLARASTATPIPTPRFSSNLAMPALVLDPAPAPAPALAPASAPTLAPTLAPPAAHTARAAAKK